MKPRGYIVLTFRFEKEGKKWVAFCEELGTSTYGRSLPEAEERILEAAALHLDTLEDVHEQERFLKEHNIKLYREKPGNVSISVSLTDNVFIRPSLQEVAV